MVTTIFLASSTTDLKIINNIKSKNVKVFSFNMKTHTSLDENHIQHEIAENYLSKSDKLKIFDLTVSYYDWYDKKDFSDNFDFEGVNLLSLLDTAEFHQHIIESLLDFLTIKRIIEKEEPREIITTSKFSNILKSLLKKKEITLTTHESSSIQYLAWDKIQIKFNIGSYPLSFYLAKSKYLKIKNTVETILCKILNLWYNYGSKKSILLLEFNPSTYKDLFANLKKLNKDIILINRRRSAIWNFDSIKTLLYSKSKILNMNKIIDSTIKNKIELITREYRQKLDDLFLKEEIFLNLFLCEGYSFWPSIKDTLTTAYKNRISEYISFLLSAKRLFEKVDISCIISLNVVGETEKIILAANKNRSTSIMMEHGFANYNHDLTRFDVLSNYSLFPDKIAVWGDIQKKYLIEHKNFDENKIIVVGSLRHDVFFNRKTKLNKNNPKIVLLTIVPISKTTGQGDTALHIKFELFVNELCRILKNISNVKLIVKLHPGQSEHNSEIIKLFKNIDSHIPIYQLTPILDLIEQCDIMININPESCDTSTVIMEGLIMKKPIITAFLDNLYHDIEFVKDNATISVSDHTNLEKIIYDILSNKDTQSRLLKNSKIHLKKYLANPGIASKRFSEILDLL